MKEYLVYSGPVDHDKIDYLLNEIKNDREFTGLDKLTRNRIYAVLVECLENIARHSSKELLCNDGMKPYISAVDMNKQVLISAGNCVTDHERKKLVARLDVINKSDSKKLNELFETEIGKEKGNNNGAGLGFIVMKLKSGNNISYKFTPVDTNQSYFELQISVNKLTMRKLIINPTSSSPKVVLDPVNRKFEISGESRPPDVAVFYKEILDWLNDYSAWSSGKRDPDDQTSIDLDFNYFNSSSAKYILDFCKQIAFMRSRGENIGVRWHYEREDSDMFEAGRVMSKTAKIPFEFIMKETD